MVRNVARAAEARPEEAQADLFAGEPACPPVASPQ